MGYNIDKLHICFKRLVLGYLNETDNLDSSIVFLQRQLQIDSVLWPIEIALCVISTFVSIVNMTVLTRKFMLCSPLNVMLVILELSNIVLSLFQLCFSVIRLVVGQYTPTQGLFYLETVSSVLTFTAAFFINWLTVMIGAWRFVAVTWPLKASSLLNKQRAAVAIIALLIVDVIPVVIFALINEMHVKEIGICTDLERINVSASTHYFLAERQWAISNQAFVDKSIVFINVLYYLLPCICFLVITLGLVWNILQYNLRQKTLREGQDGTYIEEGQIRTTLILIALLSFFLASNTLPVAIRLTWLTGNDTENFSFHFLTYVLSSYPLSFIANAMSFFAYYYMGTNFRETFHEILHRIKYLLAP